MKGQEWSVPGSPDDVSLPLPSRATRLALDPEEALEGGADGRGAGSAHAPHHPSMTAQVSLSASASVTRCTGRVLLNLVALCALTLGVVLCTVLSTTPAARIDLLPSTLAPSLSSSFSSAFSSLKGPGLMLSQKTVNLPEEGRVAPLIAPGSLGTGNWRKEEAVVDQVVNDVLFFPPSPGNGLGLGPLAEEREREREGLEAERVIVFGDACGHSRNEVAEILLQSHGWEQEERRYYVGASTNWVDVWGLLKLLERRRPRVQYNESVCILAALHGRVPCVDRRCLIPLRVRPHFTDFMVLKQLMERGDFSFLHGYNFTTILDAGANVGFATLIFAIQFPQATVVSVELSPDNYRLLKQNTQFLSNVIALNAGLHNAVETLSFSHGGDAAREGWRYQLNSDAGTVTARRKLAQDTPSNRGIDTTRGNGRSRGSDSDRGSGNEGTTARSSTDSSKEGSKGLGGSDAKGVPSGTEAQAQAVSVPRGHVRDVPIKTITVDLILQLFDLPSFDFIKMDVEGSEKEIFSEGKGYSPRSWLSGVQLLAIETHDRIKNGSSEAVQDAVKPFYKLLGTRVGEYRTWFDFTKVPHPLRHSWGGGNGTEVQL